MINPFQYGGVVGKDGFCNLKKELADLVKAMENGERLFVFSERLIGKTSLIRQALGKLPKGKLRVVLVFDEFQRILEYGNDLVERTLRSAIQDQQAISYIFLGSHKHLIQKMFLDQSRPLYRAGGHYPLGAIDIKDWVPFIGVRFSKSDKGRRSIVIQSYPRRIVRF